MKIAILTTKSQWFEAYAEVLSKQLGSIPIFNNHADFNDKYDIIFILSYYQIIPKEALEKNSHNIVIHESALPKGKGWAPLFWQTLEGKNNIPFTMIEASDGVDSGDIYMQEVLKLTGNELNEELRAKQAKLTIQMCLEFVNSYEKYKIPFKQSGDESFYLKRDKEDSRLDVDKTIKEQFNLLRIVNNSNYPAYFDLDGNRYVLKIELDKSKKKGGGID
jgi:methionyl-tRNA formyltransferase